MALAHAFVAGALETPESERPISVGGAGSVPPQVFAGFDYVALGHLHRPQQAGAPEICYAGSLMKYSFAEHDHHKSVSVVEIGAPGSADGDAGAAGRARVTVERVALHPPRDVRRLQGTLAELLQRGRTDPRRDDYVLASLLDTGAILDAVGRLREAYPNTLAIERPALDRAGEAAASRPDPRKAGEAELFESFFTHVCGDPPSDDQRQAFATVVDQLEQRRREAGS